MINQTKLTAYYQLCDMIGEQFAKRHRCKSRSILIWMRTAIARAKRLKAENGLERHAIRVTFADGNTIDTTINGTPAEIKAYYLGNQFQFGDTWQHPTDNMQTAIKLEFLKG